MADNLTSEDNPKQDLSSNSYCRVQCQPIQFLEKLKLKRGKTRHHYTHWINDCRSSGIAATVTEIA
jgi:hypothetical protein